MIQISMFRRLVACALACGASAAAAQTLDLYNPDTFTTPGDVSRQQRQQTAQQQVTPGSGFNGAALPDQTNGLPGNDTRVLRNNSPDGTNRNGPAGANNDSNEFDTRSSNQRDRFERPAQPSEFQRFVQTATGRMLPVFGADFFVAGGQAQRQLVNVPVAADYVVAPGDELIVRAWGSIDVDYRTTVDRNGQVNLPKIGSFNVAGTKASELEPQLKAQIGRLYTNFNLSVSLGQLRAVTVFVVGPARHAGVYTLPSQSTLLSAVAASGGPGANGSMRRIDLRRNGKVVSELDVYDFLVQGDKSKDLQLAAGDVIVFQPVGPRVAITGTIDTPAIYELRNAEEPLQSVLRYAGGAPVLANLNRAQLERIDPTQSKAARSVDGFRLDAAGLQKPLRDGDVLTLLAISPQFANAVTLKGHVAQPLRYSYTPGMRIRDLIPDRDALISPDFYRRKNLLVQTVDDGERNDNLLGTRDRSMRGDALGLDAAARGARRSDQTNGNANVNGGGNNGNGAAWRQGDSGDLGAAAGVSSMADGVDRPNDPTAADRGQRNPAEVASTTNRPARRSPIPLFDDLNWDYAAIERLDPSTLQTHVISFNLGKAVLQGDDANNLLLQPGDVVTIFGQQDVRVPVSRQTRLVSIEGEIGAPGVYQLEPGETLRHLLQRAGGFTSQAYVYGLEFSREETRLRQRENLTQAIARLQTLAATQTARTAANRVTDITTAQNDATSAAATQVQLSRLERVQPNGRISLELTPETRTADQLPDFPLEAADRIVVPPRPGFVTVAGAVVNSNAFLWKPGRTVGDYVKLAGLDQAADTSNMFVLRADGTVTSAGENRGFFSFGGLESQPLQPGDALIIPNQLDFETWGRALIRNLKDFGQIFSQFGIGIAAIHALNN